MPEYTREQLLRAVGITPRTFRYWVERHLIPAPVLRGPHTTYSEDHLVRVRVIHRLRKQERLRVEAVRARLAGLSPAQIRALDPASPPEPPPPEPAALSASLPAAVRWDRVELLPGLELHLRGDASPLLRRLAAEIHAHYGGVEGRSA